MNVTPPNRQSQPQQPQQQQPQQLTSEEIVARYPEAQAVLDANRNQRYASLDDMVRNNFSLESRKKVAVITAVAMPAIMLVTMLAMLAADGTLDEGALMFAIGFAFIVGLTAGITAFVVRRQLDRKIAERNASLALAATQGEDVSRYMPQRFEDLADQFQHPFDFSIYSSVDPRQVALDTEQASQAVQMEEQLAQGFEESADELEEGWREEDLPM